MTGEEEPRTAGLEVTVRAYLHGRIDSGYAIAKKAGISRQQFYRFVRGERGLTLNSLDKLCYVLGLTLKPIHQAEQAEDEATRAKQEAMQAKMKAKREEIEKKLEAKRRSRKKPE